MAVQDDIDTDPPTSEDESPLDTEEAVDEEAENGNPDDYYLGRVDKLLRLDQTGELPRLDPLSIFAKAVTKKPATPNEKERFISRLTHFIETQKSEMLPLNSDFVDFLFNRATHTRRQITAWDTFVKRTKSPDVKRARAYLQQELRRYAKIRSVLNKEKQSTPSWMSDWSRCWVGAAEEIQEEIDASLRCALSSIDDLCMARASARIEVESYTLWLEKEEIRKHPAAARNLEVTIAAFAYATMLIRPKSDDALDLVDYVGLIKQRLSRVATSKEKRMEALTIRLRAMIGALDGQSESASS